MSKPRAVREDRPVGRSRPGLALLALAAALGQAQAQDQQGPAPREVVQAFMDLAFVQGRATEAAHQYISAQRYRQHNPQAADGRAAFIAGFGRFVEQSGFRCVVHRLVAEGELVVAHSHCKQRPADPKERGSAVVDIFRVENGLITEHWDVEQAVPARAANRNTMF
nr:nuclear transport factor 2 family protein [uncultured Roseateles sp.]